MKNKNGSHYRFFESSSKELDVIHKKLNDVPAGKISKNKIKFDILQNVLCQEGAGFAKVKKSIQRNKSEPKNRLPYS